MDDTARRTAAYHDTAGRRLAYLESAGEGPTIVWLGGLRSDMRGTKAERIEAYAKARGRAFLRFDYSGHGESDGRFEDGTISRWTNDAAAVIDAHAPGPLLLVGSSMGAWVALRLVNAMRTGGDSARVRGLLLLAPAPDFTTHLVEPSLTQADCEGLVRDGFITRGSQYDPSPMVYTRALIEDGARSAVMTGPIATGCPVRIIQGMADPDVPHTHALELVEHLPGDAVTLTLVRDGDHRLSREEDLVRMERALDELIEAGKA